MRSAMMNTPFARMTLPGLARYQDWTLLGLRLLTGAFLIVGVLDNIASAERMQEFIGFMTQNGFSNPEFWAPFSVWAQFVCGVLLVLGLFTRAAGMVIAINFVVAVIMVFVGLPFRDWWPAIVLVFLGLHFAAAGAGRFGLDSWISGHREGVA